MLYIRRMLNLHHRTSVDLAHVMGVSPSTACELVGNRYKGNNDRRRRQAEAAVRRWGWSAEDIEKLWDVVEDAPEAELPSWPVAAQEPTETVKQEDFMMHRGLSQDVLKHFGLFRDPFQHPEARDEVYRSYNLKMAESAIIDCAERHQFTAVIGETGSGKTTARDSALDRLERTGKVHIVYPEPVISERLTAPMIVTTLLASLDQPAPSDLTRRTAVTRAVLKAIRESNENVLLIIEEAHLLHPSTLRSLKHLYEIQSGFQKLIGILLIGQGALERKLGDYSLAEVSSRVRRVRLQEMSVAEISEYLEHRCAMVRGEGAAAAIFSPDSAGYIAARAKYPQAVNNVARMLMEKAYDLGCASVSRDVLAA